MKKIDEYIGKIDEMMCKRMNTILTKNFEIKECILRKVSEESNTIDRYINLLEYIKAKSLKNQLTNLENDLKIANIIH